MFSSMKVKIAMPVIIVLMVLVVGTISLVITSTESFSREILESRIDGLSNVAMVHLNRIGDNIELAAYSTSVSDTFVSHMQMGDMEALSRFLDFRKTTFDVSGFVVIYPRGRVFLHTYAPLEGDVSIMESSFVEAAFRGEVLTTYFSVYDVLPMAIVSAAPVYSENGEIIGVVVAYKNMSTEGFVDSFAEDFDASVTVFLGDTSVASTIPSPFVEGERAVGTQIDAEIASVVLGGAPHSGELNILGEFPHKVSYNPLRGHDGAVLGIFFIGFCNYEARNVAHTLHRSLYIIGGVSLILSIALMLFIIMKLMEPLKLLTQSVSQISTADAQDKNITIYGGKRADEVGDLSRTIQDMLDTLRQSQETLNTREMAERTNLIIESTPMAITLFNKEFQPIDCNERAAKMFGASGKEDYLKNFTAFMVKSQNDGGNSQEYINSFLIQAFKDGYAHIPEFICQNAKCEPIIAENTYIRIRHQDEHAVMEYSRDVTEQKNAEELIAQEKEKSKHQAKELARKLVDNTPVLIELWEADGTKCIGCNKYLMDTLGIEKESDFTENWTDYCAPIQPDGTSAQERTTRLIKQVTAEGFLRTEWLYVLPNNEELSTETTWIKIDHDGKSMVIVYSVDLRPIKSAVESEESNKAKSRFLARMSHEIRTPISAVMGISEVHLRNQNLTAQTEEAFSKIYDSSKTLLTIVNDILDFSKIESGKMSLVTNEYDVASLVSDVAQLHLVYAESKAITFELTVDENLPIKLHGDALRIKQIINNLLTNAFKYTEVGKVSLSLHCEKRPKGYVALVITIKDTGMGMTDEQMNALKGEYVRHHEQEKPFVGGTGLGLPIVYSLVQMMSAHFDLKSEVGKGSSAVVTIPQEVLDADIIGQELAESLQKFESKTWSAATGLAFVPEKMPHGKVLVVDDVDTNLYVAEAMLETFGLTIELCESGQEALDKIAQGSSYDVIFMDHMMPGLDGIETTKRLRNSGYHRPIIALTANAVKGQSEMFMNNGFSGFMAKPIDIKLLNSYLVRYVQANDE